MQSTSEDVRAEVIDGILMPVTEPDAEPEKGEAAPRNDANYFLGFRRIKGSYNLCYRLDTLEEVN